MKTSYLLIVLIFFLVSCNPVSKKAKKEHLNPATPIHKTAASKSQSNIKHNVFKLPILGSFDLSAMKIDSSNNYSFEDCIGKTIRYSDAGTALVADSLTCKDDIYIYTYYLLNDKNKIVAVNTKKLGFTLVPGQQSYSFVLTEKIYNFSTTPATLWERSDTLESALSKPADKPLLKKNLENTENSYKLWNMKLSGVWRLK